MAINTEHQEANAQGAARFKKGHKKLVDELRAL